MIPRARAAGRGGSRAGVGGNKGAFYVIQPTDNEGQHSQPHRRWMDDASARRSAYNGKIYMQTTTQALLLRQEGEQPRRCLPSPRPRNGRHPGRRRNCKSSLPKCCSTRADRGIPRPLAGCERFHGRGNEGRQSGEMGIYIPPTARVRATMNAAFDATGKLVAPTRRQAFRRRVRGDAGRLERLHPRTRAA